MRHLCALAALTAIVTACGSSSTDDADANDWNGTGAGTASGGVTATGGVSATGGYSATGGVASTGGQATGGTSSVGGTQGGTGGATSSGGDTGSGGVTATGGTTSQSCPAQSLQPGDTTRTLNVGGKSRTYVLHVPSTYHGDAPAPLVVDFHPLGGSGPNERNGSPYPAQTDPEGVVMAFPSGLAGPSGGAWNVGPCCVKDVDDVAFARALVEDVQQTACIDSKRIYAVGFSMGGGMSHYLACHAADVFAAVAPAAFDLLEENVDDCKPSRHISVVSFRGTDDPLVKYAGGYSNVVSGMPITFLGAEKTAQTWAQKNQCTGAASAKDAKGCSTYSGCPDGIEVTLCTKQGGGHEAANASITWPLLKQHVMP